MLGAHGIHFDDSKASWGLNRHISARCGQTYSDTFNFWRKEFPPDDPIPFVMIETWNDYEEGTAIEPGIAKCGSGSRGSLLSKYSARSIGGVAG